MFKKLLRDPLLHFAVLAVFIYWLMNALSPSLDQQNSQIIEISDGDLITFLQNRDQVFDQDLYRQKLANSNQEQRSLIESQLVEQEVLIREARKLGLDQNDQLLRRRLIQKIKYFLEGVSNASVSIEPNQIKEFYADQNQTYLKPATISFTHIFFKAVNANDDSAIKRASAALNDHSEGKTALSPAISDHFPYHRHYVDKSSAQISRHFGGEFAAALFELNASTKQWQGPIESAYGQHLLLINKKTSAHVPELDSIRDKVTQDLRRKLHTESLQKQIDQLVEQYTMVNK